MSDVQDRQAAWGRMGGLTAWSRHSAERLLGPARRGFAAKFEILVDPTSVLPREERMRRAERARRAYMLRLAERSAEVRRMKKTDPACSSAGSVKEAVDGDDDLRGAG